MNEKRMQQFLSRYEEAGTRREKTMAVYNAMAAAMPQERMKDFIGAGADAFLSFVKTMQNEDSDAGTAVAREKDAPCLRYLAALVEKLKAQS